MQIFLQFFSKFLKISIKKLKEEMRGPQGVARGACSVHI